VTAGDSAADIFLTLADLDPTERDAALRERCAGDVELRVDVEAMLAALNAADDGFLDPARIPTLDMAAVDGPLQPGTVLGGFLVLHAIGSGGMGVVYAAQQDRPRRTVAIKVLRRGFRHPEVVKRFAREAEMLGRLQHPGIAQVIAFHPGDGDVPAHLVMELVAGPPFTEYARAHSLGIAARLRLTVAICEAVQHAHDRGIVHRDLKPANVLVTEDGQPKVLDFGIARAVGLDMYSSVQTAHGQLLGTLAFMSPEQLRGTAADAVDGRSDVYALGVLLYRLMADRLPFEVGGMQLVEAVQKILNTTAPPLGSIDPALAGSLEQVVARAMSPDRAHRYASAADLASDVRAVIDGRRPALAGIPATSRAPVLVAESVDGRFVAIGLASGVVVVIDAASGAPRASVANDAPLRELSFDRDGRLAIYRAGSRVDWIDPDAPN
jgi:tRNA A-37 threonylcarbamoyl transferase component Bud32